MLKQSQLVSVLNTNLNILHKNGASLEVPLAPEDVILRWIRDGWIENRELYAPGDIVPHIMKRWVQENSTRLKSSEHRKWSPIEVRDRDRIIKISSPWKSIKETAAEAGCSESTVKRVLHNRITSIIGRAHMRHLTIQALHEDGWTKEELIRGFDISERTVRRALKE